MTGFFQIDWILVDIIIIILLLLLLFGVKVFKITHRWRNSFSNQALENFCFSQEPKITENHFHLKKKWSLTRNLSLKEKFSTSPFIIIFGKTYKRNFLKILTEGLCSYGFNVINLKIKFKDLSDLSESITLDKTIKAEWKSLISAIIDKVKNTEIINNYNYIILNHSKPIITYIPLSSDPNNLGVLMINPKLNKKNSSAFYNITQNNTKSAQIYTIFSKRSKIILKNRHLKKFLKEIDPQKTSNLQCLIIKKATYSFRYYETVLLGMIIDIIENKLLKSKS
ncbi:MAG: hypothetical protein ACFFG0_14605 [Candidatus Thorarchaeota archaeon]